MGTKVSKLLGIILFIISSNSIVAQEVSFSKDFFVTGLDRSISHAEIINGELYIGGDFDWYNGDVKLNGVAKWNGETWEAMGNGFGGNNSTFVFDFEYFEGELYAAGSFKNNGEGEDLYNVAKWNGTKWEAVGNGLRTTALGGAVHRIIVFEGELYAGGRFDESSTTDLKNIAKWDGENWIPDGFFDSRVYDLQIVNNQLVAIGGVSQYIDSVNNDLPNDLFVGEYEITQLNVSNSVSGRFANGYLFNTTNAPFYVNLTNRAVNPFIEGTPRSFGASYLPTFGGFNIDFTLGFNEDSTVNISFVQAPVSCGSSSITFDAADDSLGFYDPSDDSSFIFALVENASLACGDQTDTIRFSATKLVTKQKKASTDINHVAVKSDSSWSALNFNHNLASFRSSAILNDELYIFGRIYTSEGDTVTSVKWDGTSWEIFDVPEDYTFIYNSSVINDELYVSSIAGWDNYSMEYPFLRKWDGETWISYSDRLANFRSFSIVEWQGELHVFGDVTSYDSQNIIRHAARWDGEKFVALDSPSIGNAFNSQSSGFDSFATDLELMEDGSIVISGRFTGVTDSVPSIGAVYNNSSLISLDEYTNHRFDGTYYNFNAKEFKHVLFFSSGLQFYNKVDEAVFPGLGSQTSLFFGDIHDFDSYDNRLIAGGLIGERVGDTESYYNVAQWDGLNWSPIGNGFDFGEGVLDLLVTSNGELIVGGDFTESEEVSTLGVARFDTVENKWAPLYESITTEFLEVKVDKMIEFNGDIILAGFFDTGTEVYGIARFNGLGISPMEDVNDVDYHAFTELEIHKGDLYAAGKGTLGELNIFRWNEAPGNWSALAEDVVLRNQEDDTFGEFSDLLSTEDGLYFSGEFDEVNGIPMNNVGLMQIIEVSNEFEDTTLSFELHQNYPNPFNPSTEISFQLPVSSITSLKVYDLLGRQVTELVNRQLPSGSHEFTFDASVLSSGIYIYRLEAGNQVQIRKMMLIK